MHPNPRRHSSTQVRKRVSKSHPKSDEELSAHSVIRDMTNLFDSLNLNAEKRPTSNRGRSKKFQQRYLKHPSAIGEMMTLWHQNPEYLNKKGEPIGLRLNGRKNSFFKLAAQAAPRLNPLDVLNDLKRLGAVAIDKRGYIQAKTRALSVYEDRQLAAQYTLRALSSFIRTLRHNLDSAVVNSEQLFHRVAWNDRIGVSEIPKLKIWLRNRGQLFLESADNWMLRRSIPTNHAGRNKKSARQVSIGVYLSVDKLPP
jgi:hypothetical protein